MKRNFYPFFLSSKKPALLLAFMLACAVAVNAQTYTINFPNSPPATSHPSVDQNDFNGFGIETGVRFRVTQSGTITGIRFYKGDAILGFHIGHIWNNNGTSKLAEATFSETANGWQEVAVSVHITPADTIVASVFNNFGDYAAEPPGDTWQDQGGADYGTDPIKVLAWSNDPAHNGVYVYTNSANGAFPNSNSGAPNYWIDVRFQPDFSLPVTLNDIKAINTNNDIAVSWKTSSESNNKGFEIQRSNNGSDWYAIGFVNGAGESTVTKNYSYTDKQLAPGLYYYRLKQVDFDGRSKNSSVVTASVSGKGKVSLFQNYPNPFAQTTTIRFDLPTAQKIRLSIVDMAGREVKVLANKQGEAGSHLVTLSSTGLSRQAYFIRLQTESAVLTNKILVQ
ncbi:MAG TPA: DUF4082 domain-containing protein [Chitinophagaceae bacterium]